MEGGYWKGVPIELIENWRSIFSENKEGPNLSASCPVCNRNTLLQYYSLNVHGPMKYKKKLYKGQGAHWEWCAFCFHYKYENLTYVPLEWTYELEIEPWELMSIPEPINEKMR